jgi:hypothetical protein
VTARMAMMQRDAAVQRGAAMTRADAKSFGMLGGTVADRRGFRSRVTFTLPPIACLRMLDLDLRVRSEQTPAWLVYGPGIGRLRQPGWKVGLIPGELCCVFPGRWNNRPILGWPCR